jgi:hypothetical protein
VSPYPQVDHQQHACAIILSSARASVLSTGACSFYLEIHGPFLEQPMHRTETSIVSGQRKTASQPMDLARSVCLAKTNKKLS